MGARNAIIARRRGLPWHAALAANGNIPGLSADFANNRYWNSGAVAFSDLLTSTRTAASTMVDATGLLKWSPHNLALNSAAPVTQSITVVSGADYTVECTGTGSITLSNAGTGSVSLGAPVEITAATTTLTLTIVGSVDTMWAYRSDLGGMVNNPDRGDSYVPTTASAVFMPRRNHHVYDGTSWVNRGVLVEPEAATNLLLNSGTLSTQSATVTAVAHTLHFTGTGTVTLSGVSTAGPLVGTGTGENNRVSLTFTPTAGSLTLTVSGAATNAQLEAGSVPTSYVHTDGATATRPLETLAIPAANIPDYMTPTVISEELVSDVGFDSAGAWTLSGTSISGGLAIWSSAAQDAYVLGSGLFENGKVYTVTVEVDSYTSGDIEVRFGGSSTDTRLNISGAGQYTATGVATGTALLLLAFSGSTTISLTSVSIKEINPLAVSIQMDGLMTYADEGAAAQDTLLRWYVDASNYITYDIDTDGAATGEINFNQATAGVLDTVASATTAYAAGINVPFNIASRHGSTFINGAVDGTALTEDATPVALADLSAADIELVYSGGPMIISAVSVWPTDITDVGIAGASA